MLDGENLYATVLEHVIKQMMNKVHINLKKSLNAFGTFPSIYLYIYDPIIWSLISAAFSIVVAIYSGSICALYGEHATILRLFWTKYIFLRGWG